MKHITVTDEDYKTLMELSKELQLQENDSQAFPYFWEPISTKKVGCSEGDSGAQKLIYNDGDTYNQEEFEKEYGDLDDQPEAHVYYEKDDRIVEHNPSFFKSDIKDFCNHNSHHLGVNPGTYARSVYRLPKMKQLIEAIYRLNKQPKAFVNAEALRFVWNRESTKNEFVDVKQVIERAGLGASHQRIAIFQFLTENNKALAKQIHEGLKEEIPTLSKTTIYNTLKCFNKAGLSWRN